MSVNKVTILGRLGSDPELKYTPGGKAVCNFTVATSESWSDKSGQKQERTEWHRIVVWGKLAELCNQYLAKGRQVYIEGSLQTRSWDDKAGEKRYTTEVVAGTVQFIGSSNASQSSEKTNEYSSKKDESKSNTSSAKDGKSLPRDPGEDSEFDVNFTSDDIPF